MGGGTVEDSEGEESSPEEQLPSSDKMDSSPLKKSMANLKPLQSTRIQSQTTTTASETPSVIGLHSKADLHLGGQTKHRIPSPAREQGDGMEAEAVAQITGEVKVAPAKVCPPRSVGNVNKRLITLPQTNIKLDKLPPITADRDIELPAQIPANPLVQMTVSPPKPATEDGGNLVGARTQPRHSKEPKFVPYEPYKAAVTPMLPLPPRSKRAGSLQGQPHRRRRSSVASSTASSVNKSVKDPDQMEGGRNCDEDQARGANVPVATTTTTSEVVVESSPLEKANPKAVVDEGKLVAGLLREATEKIKDLESKLAESEKQLRIQTQVNHEVKKLLVASVGEDIEAKVDYLTQDKARLSADIRQYSNKICKDFEEKEKLSVESDLWKSKFLACSVIVDELARWKASLLQRNEEFDHQVRLLLHERSILWGSLDNNLEVLSNLKAAFDPLSKVVAASAATNAQEGQEEVCSVLGLADLSAKTATELSERLLGSEAAAKRSLPSLPKDKATSAAKREQIGTPAEDGLKELVSAPFEHLSGGGQLDDYSTKASVAITGAARPHLAKMNDKLAAPKVNSSQFKCCTHCTGTVHVV